MSVKEPIILDSARDYTQPYPLIAFKTMNILPRHKTYSPDRSKYINYFQKNFWGGGVSSPYSVIWYKIDHELRKKCFEQYGNELKPFHLN